MTTASTDNAAPHPDPVARVALPGAPPASPPHTDTAAAPAGRPDAGPITLLDVSPVAHHMENLDALRILCMVVIIFVHVTAPFLDLSVARGERTPLFSSILSLNVATRFGVPCFMMISFFIYWHQLYEKGRTWPQLLKRRFTRLLPAFLCWSLFYFIVAKVFIKLLGTNDYAGHEMHNWNWKSLAAWRDILVFGKAWGHLYYLPVVMQSLLVIPLLALLWRSAWRSWTFIALMAALWTTTAYGRSFFDEGTAQRAFIEKVGHYMHEETAVPLLVFPLLGLMCAGQASWRRFLVGRSTGFWLGVLAFGVALHVTETLILAPRNYVQALAGLHVGRLITGIAVFILFIRYPLMKDPWPRVSRHAFGLHFMHPFIILLLGIAQMKLLGPTLGLWKAWVIPLLLVNFVLTFWITFGLCLLVGRYKRLQFLVV